jgi:superfamily II DNA/RNA helicase
MFSATFTDDVLALAKRWMIDPHNVEIEPESVATDYADFPDLTGEPIWGRISAAADRQDDAELRWYHYDTQEPYTFLCFVRRAGRDNGMVMVCR